MKEKLIQLPQFPGEGIVAFGQKTLQDRASALDRINVRRLLIKVKKYIASTSRYLVFEQNTSQTRGKILKHCKSLFRRNTTKTRFICILEW